ncbi:7TMR-DISMED2 domain-containing protein [Solemya pervernicosa gill symbiont]|nr:7TM-DISM domain-containing protein [Solemya pervernicosa gill symbiont]
MKLLACQLLLLFSFFTSPQLIAAVQLESVMSGLSVADEMTIIEDRDSSLTIEKLLERTDPEQHHNSRRVKTFKGMSRSVWWVVIDVENSSGERIDWMLESVHPHTDYLDLYHVDASSTITVLKTGDRRPFSDRKVASETFVFPLATPAQSKERIVLRFDYADLGIVELATRIWDPDSFHESKTIVYALYGILIGGAIFAIIFNLIVHIPTQFTTFYLVSRLSHNRRHRLPGQHRGGSPVFLE